MMAQLLKSLPPLWTFWIEFPACAAVTDLSGSQLAHDDLSPQAPKLSLKINKCKIQHHGFLYWCLLLWVTEHVNFFEMFPLMTHRTS